MRGAGFVTAHLEIGAGSGTLPAPPPPTNPLFLRESSLKWHSLTIRWHSCIGAPSPDLPRAGRGSTDLPEPLEGMAVPDTGADGGGRRVRAAQKRLSRNQTDDVWGDKKQELPVSLSHLHWKKCELPQAWLSLGHRCGRQINRRKTELLTPLTLALLLRFCFF